MLQNKRIVDRIECTATRKARNEIKQNRLAQTRSASAHTHTHKIMIIIKYVFYAFFTLFTRSFE